MFNIDGVIHEIRKTQAIHTKKMHDYWHKTPREGCEFCLEQTQPPPAEVAIQQQEVEVAEQRQPELRQQESEIKSETAMQQAFRRIAYGTK